MFDKLPNFIGLTSSTGWRTFISNTQNDKNIFFFPTTAFGEGAPQGYYMGALIGGGGTDFFYIYKNNNSIIWYVETDSSSPSTVAYSAKQFNVNNLKYDYIFL